MANKQDELGLKFRLAVDVENKYFFDGFSYVEKDGTQSSDVSALTDEVMKLMGQIFQLGCNVPCHNFSPHLTWYSDSQKRSFRTMPQNRKFQKCPKRRKSCTKEKLRLDSETPVTLTSYQCKSKKKWQFLVAYIQMLKFQTKKIQKRNPTQYCNRVTPKLEVTYMMKRRDCFLMKAGIRKWHVEVFYDF